jgi:cytidyltransferase-like protein
MKTVLAGGCFNRIHDGHIYFLKRAKTLGDYFVVVLTNDSNNRKRYRMPAEIRKTNLVKLGIADKILIGNRKNYSKIVEKVRPDIIALGYDQELPAGIDETRYKIAKINKYGEYSTSKLS